MNSRVLAAQALKPVLLQQGSLNQSLPDRLTNLKGQNKERALVQELCFGTLRWQPRLQCYLDALMHKPLKNRDADIHALLLIGLYQITCMRTPDHAAINETVNAAKAMQKIWAAQLINGVLRNFIRRRDELEQQLTKKAVFTHAHPLWLEEKIASAWPQQAEDILQRNNQHPPFTLRINKRKIHRLDYLKLLEKNHIEAEPTAYSSVGITLTQPTTIEALPHFAEGYISVQDEAAQFAAQLLDLSPEQRVLDACCAPGGKTCHILETEPQLGEVIALDNDAQRIERVRENLSRLELEAKLITADAGDLDSWWDQQTFDRILLDAPCSATGVIRRHPDIKLLRQAKDLVKLATLQEHLLKTLWTTLKPGGVLVYATCSLLPEENEQVIDRFIAQTPGVICEPLNSCWGIQRAYGQQLFPQENGHDGFYYAKLKKQETTAIG